MLALQARAEIAYTNYAFDVGGNLHDQARDISVRDNFAAIVGTAATDSGTRIAVTVVGLDGTPLISFGNQGRLVIPTIYQGGGGAFAVAGGVAWTAVNGAPAIALVGRELRGSIFLERRAALAVVSDTGVPICTWMTASASGREEHDSVVSAGGNAVIVAGTVILPNNTVRTPFLRKFLIGGNPAACQLDPSFGNQGTALLGIASAHYQVSRVLRQPSGRILLSGEETSSSGIRSGVIFGVTSNGLPDSSFSPFSPGVIRLTLNDQNGPQQISVTNISLDGTGRILAAAKHISGSSNSYAGVWRFNQNGSYDLSFGGGSSSVRYPTMLSFNEQASNTAIELSSVVSAEDGRIIVVGRAVRTQSPFNQASMRVVALLPTGESDISYSIKTYEFSNDANGIEEVGPSLSVGENVLTALSAVTVSPSGYDFGLLYFHSWRDADLDGVNDEIDNCLTFNPDQIDGDGDGLGDACDTDDDGDGYADGSDNCPYVPNPDQADFDTDGIGDACETDYDNDGIANSSDNCPLSPNPDQNNTDGDADGNACDQDDDGDGVADNAPDNCPLVANPEQTDTDNDGIGDACEGDADGDGVGTLIDNCPLIANPDQADADNDGIGDVCDGDGDGDGVPNLGGPGIPPDNCPLVANPDQADGDQDGLGNLCDPCPQNPNLSCTVGSELSVTPIVIGASGGMLSPDTVQFVPPGGYVQFTILPAPGYAVSNLQGTCGGTLAGKLYNTNPVTDDCTVEATFTLSDEEFLLTYIAGANGSISGPQEQTVQAGETGLPVTAVPSNGYFFVKWSDGVTDAVRQDANVIGDIMVTAEFAANGTATHIVTPTWEAGGTLWPNVPLVTVEGDNAVFTIKPNLGFGIADITGCDGTLVGNKYVTAPVLADCEVHAVFEPSSEVFTLTYTASSNGQVNGQHQMVATAPAGGQGIEVEAQPGAGYFFVQWSDGSTDNPRIDTNIVGNIDVVAHFAANGTNVYEVTPKSGLGGALSPPVKQFVAEGSSAQFILLPNEGHAVAAITGSCGGTLSGNVYTTDPVTANCTVEASFGTSDEEFTLTYAAGPHGGISGLQEQIVQAGGSGQLVMAVPDNGYFFVKWSDGVSHPARQDAHVTSDIAVTAEFAINGTLTHIVTPHWGGGGSLWPNVPLLVMEGDNAVLTVKPNLGFGIAGVTGCDGTLIGNKYVTAPVLADCEVHAAFESSDEVFSLTYTAGANGEVNGQPQVAADVAAGGSGIEVEAQPAPGYFFVQWNDGSMDNPRIDTNVAVDIDVTAQFAANGTDTYEVMPKSGLGGALSPPVTQLIAQGATAQFNVISNAGYFIAVVDGTCGGDLSEGSGNAAYVTDPVIHDCTVEASFSEDDSIFSNGFE